MKPEDGRLMVSARAALLCASLLLACGSERGGAAGSSAGKGPTVGQSGSEGVPSSGGGSTVPCPCGLQEGLRVTVLAKEGDLWSLRVEEVLHGSPPVAPGDVLEATSFDDTFVCFRGCANIDVGDQALAFYAPGEPLMPPCVARDECVALCDAENQANEAEVYMGRCACREGVSPTFQGSAWQSPTCGIPVVDGGRNCRMECEAETAEVCPPRPEQDFKRGLVRLSPWADPIVFARGAKGELRVSRDQLGELFEPSGDVHACIERFGDWSNY